LNVSNAFAVVGYQILKKYHENKTGNK
jgi:hypothetical protein